MTGDVLQDDKRWFWEGCVVRERDLFTARANILGTGRRGGKGSVVGEKQKRSWGTSQFLLSTGEACTSVFWF